MNRVTFAFGLLLIVLGTIALVSRIQDPSAAGLIAEVKKSGGENPQSIAGFVTGLILPIVTPLAIGIAFVVLGLMGRAPVLFGWFGR